MATKAELEAELALLRKQLAEKPRPDPAAAPTEAPTPEPEEAEDQDELGKLDLDREISELMKEMEDFPHKQALLLALGVFALGYLVGRTR